MWRTSARGRIQFSVENPNTVSQPMSLVTATRTSRARFSSPSVWPSVRGSPRRPAQRPLPSMMQATCSGIVTHDMAQRWETDGVGSSLAHVMVVAGTRRDWRRIDEAGWRRLAAELGAVVADAGGGVADDPWLRGGRRRAVGRRRGGA